MKIPPLIYRVIRNMKSGDIPNLDGEDVMNVNIGMLQLAEVI